MTNRLVNYGCLFCIVSIGILTISSDAWSSRRFNQEDIQKQMGGLGASAQGEQTQQERLESLRGQRGNYNAGTNSQYVQEPKKKSAADVKIPPGTHVKVKLDKALSTSDVKEGEPFTGRLEGNLNIDSFLLASSGGKVYGTIVKSEEARNVAGTSILEFKLTGVTIDKQVRSIESNHTRVESKKSGRVQAKASIEAGKVVDFNIGELGSDIGNYGTQTIGGEDKKVSDRVEERHNSRRHRRKR